MAMTRKQFQHMATAAFVAANPTAKVEWLTAKFVTYPTGHRCWQGKFTAEAPGYRPRVMTATGDDDGVLVR